MTGCSEITELLNAWAHGDAGALNKLIPLVYGELRKMARHHLRRERPDHTLQTTALVHEVYTRLVDVDDVDWRGRSHFLALAAQMMRRVLVDYARAQQCRKRGGSAMLLPIRESLVFSPAQSRPLIALDDALNALARFDPRKCRVIEMRFFGGLSVEETALALGVSPETVARDWKLARAWLARELKRSSQ